MHHAISFARHFCRLVWLLVEEPENVAEQKASLRALAMVGRDGAVTLSCGDGGLRAEGHAISDAFSGTREVIARFASHRVADLRMDRAATAADLLTAARLLAAAPDPQVSVDDRLRAAGAATVHAVPHPPAEEPILVLPSLTGEFDLLLDQLPAIPNGPAESLPVTTPSYAPPAVPATPAGGGIFDHIAAVQRPVGHTALLEELGCAPDGGVADIANRLGRLAEDAERHGDGSVLFDIADALVTREREAPDWLRRELALALRRILNPRSLRLVASLLPRRAADRDAVHRILARMGDAGADAVIELLNGAEAASDRRAYFDMVVSLGAGIPTLLHMLHDDRWYVVRNAVDLLGELGVVEGEGPIVELLRHDDLRVRESAMLALLRMDTPAGRAARAEAVESGSAATRQRAVVALAGRRDRSTASMLVRALDRERDQTVQRSIIAALGAVASPDAVERLIAAAAPSRSLFRRTPTWLRAAAVRALGEAGTPAAWAALRALAGDQEPEVRQAARHALAQAPGGPAAAELTAAPLSAP